MIILTDEQLLMCKKRRIIVNFNVLGEFNEDSIIKEFNHHSVRAKNGFWYVRSSCQMLMKRRSNKRKS